MDILEQHQELANLVQAADSVGDAILRVRNFLHPCGTLYELQRSLSELESRIAGMLQVGHHELDSVWGVELQRIERAYGVPWKEELSDWMMTDGKPR